MDSEKQIPPFIRTRRVSDPHTLSHYWVAWLKNKPWTKGYGLTKEEALEELQG